ncbi:MAG: adenylate/guanylate cyclase domain-containing protein [Spirochaetes bacterium]|nr:adenylate/guanylate cyclase domain-containing protein [Spirochaetota bacterium]
MNGILDIIFGKKIGGSRIMPVSIKIIGVFTVFILGTGFVSNYINLLLNRNEQLRLARQILVKELKDIHTFCNNQFEIVAYSGDKKAALDAISKRAMSEFKNSKALAVGVKEDGKVLFLAYASNALPFEDRSVLALMATNRARGVTEGWLPFRFNGADYFGMYKFNQHWDMYVLRGEEENEFRRDSRNIMTTVAIIISLITLVAVAAGIFLLSYILRFVRVMTDALIAMDREQKITHIDLKGASNDDITFLGMSFNSVANTISTLLAIFRKFVNKDIALKAYREREIRLEGSRMELTMLFSDIKGFTTITEMLGTDIIKLLNMHYDKAIHEIIHLDGVIGSIIGDAVLAVFGAIEESTMNKSYASVQAGYRIQAIAAGLRKQMKHRHDEMTKKKRLTEIEEKVYHAVLIEVGVGIDGGEVFYGNIGSFERMTNTVIGDTVNSASRLEGLTRVYKVPVICSEYVKNDIEENVKSHGVHFVEIDTVMVKGKTVGKKIFWPVPHEAMNASLEKQIALFEAARERYDAGQCPEAKKAFAHVTLPIADVFRERLSQDKPTHWNGIWTMTSK